VTKGIIDRRKVPFAMDTITVPYKNRHGALFFTAGHDFTTNGDCYVATAHGDVWKVRGIDEELKELKWHRFATGLYQPLGLRVVKDQVFVLGRDQITRLHDKNGDGEADFYEAFNNDIMIGGGGHSYATCLETDPDGNHDIVVKRLVEIRFTVPVLIVEPCNLITPQNEHLILYHP
jgi:hypothetical protein